jgi:hypothetical protein
MAWKIRESIRMDEDTITTVMLWMHLLVDLYCLAAVINVTGFFAPK